jgi:hypothetical protein
VRRAVTVLLTAVMLLGLLLMLCVVGAVELVLRWMDQTLNRERNVRG